MTEIRHIVFDLGNVLLRWNPELPYRRLIPDPVVRKRFLADICNGDWLIQTDRGMDWPEAETALIARHPEEAEMIRAFRKHWHEMAPGLVEGSSEILTELLDRGYDVTALTNFAADTFLEVKPRFPILDRFRGVTVSAHAGFAKPDPDIYRHHAEAFGLSPPNVLFFDDTMKNVVAARAAGWHAEQFIDAKGMRADLARYGVDVV
jgi:HAD superfamily hydrolase (TIGR01509 family)